MQAVTPSHGTTKMNQRGRQLRKQGGIALRYAQEVKHKIESEEQMRVEALDWRFPDRTRGKIRGLPLWSLLIRAGA